MVACDEEEAILIIPVFSSDYTEISQNITSYVNGQSQHYHFHYIKFSLKFPKHVMHFGLPTNNKRNHQTMFLECSVVF